MNKNDCLWVAFRVTGLAFLFVAILTIPQLYTSGRMMASVRRSGVEIDGAHQGVQSMHASMESAGRVAVNGLALQFLLCAIAACYFLAGAPGLREWAGKEETPPSAESA